MDISLQGFDRLEQAFKHSPELVGRELLAWVETTTAHLTDEITSITPKVTGLLRGSIKPGAVKVGALGVTAIISTPLNYALPVEFGVKRKERKSKSGKLYIHPGMKGYRMFTKAFEANTQQVQDSFTHMVDRVLARIAAGAA